jgi:hypothetical protein
MRALLGRHPKDGETALSEVDHHQPHKHEANHGVVSHANVEELQGPERGHGRDQQPKMDRPSGHGLPSLNAPSLSASISKNVGGLNGAHHPGLIGLSPHWQRVAGAQAAATSLTSLSATERTTEIQ